MRRLVTSCKVVKAREGDEQKRYLKAYGAGLVNLTQFREQVKDLRERREKIEGQINDTNKKSSVPEFDLAKVKDLPSKVAKVLESVGFEDKKFILRNILENVVVGDSNKVCVNGYIPMNIQVQKVGLSAESRYRWFAKCW